MKYDAIIIGFGQGANSVAAQLAAKDWKVALIEKDSENYGGSCINIGCIPTKMLEHDTRSEKGYTEAVERRNKVIEGKRRDEKETVQQNDQVDLYTGTASFTDNYTVEVETAEETLELTSDHIVISTGSEPVMPPIEGLEETDNIYTSTTLQLEKELPETLGIIGGGNIGIEFASIYADYGSKVRMIDTKETFLEGEEPEVAEEVKSVLEGKGVDIQLGTNVEKVRNEEGLVIATTDKGEEHRFHALLVAAGRKPHTSSLNLDSTDIELTENGGVQTDKHLRTTVEGIYALGDVRGEEMFTYITTNDAKIVLSDLVEEGELSLDQRKNVPYSIFMDPPLAHVGLTEKQAEEEGYNVATNTAAVKDTARSAIINDDRGLYKAVVEPESEKLLGMTLFGDQAHELVNMVKTVMDHDLPYTVLRDQMLTHPVMTEIFNTLLDI